MKKFTIDLKDEKGGIIGSFSITRSELDEDSNMNDFILDCLKISEDKRELPLKVVCPNGLEVYPSIKMKFKNFGSPLLGDELESMHVCY